MEFRVNWIVDNLFVIPLLPLAAAGIIAVSRRPRRVLARNLAIGSMVAAFGFSVWAFVASLGMHSDTGPARAAHNFDWFQIGDSMLRLGWVLDPLSAVMLVMVTFVGALIFIYSAGYMAHDENFTRFFGFLSLFAAAMLGLVIANNLLLLFMCWEVVGLASYLLIGFWYHKPSASAASKKAFITTRIGDVVFFLGILWLYGEAGTLLFYDDGKGCLESSALTAMVARTTIGGMAVTAGIGLLIFCGAIGKSGQVPLHVWLPDAMEGPTPVSALIHAATMVAAGVFLVARMYPLMVMHGGETTIAAPAGHFSAMYAVTWVGAITAAFAACIAVAQTDIKRILAYSTVSQLGFMMLGLGTGGVAVGMFHLITHAFFKALLFLGAGSVIHGCHEEQDIRRMGGIRKFMPVTFATYTIGMCALSGVPVFFSGFWSKDGILHSAHGWELSHGPFYLGLFAALLTAFYMTRQMCYVFFGKSRLEAGSGAHGTDDPHGHEHSATPHESPAAMTIPLVILAVFAVLLGVIGTPAWPWFQDFLSGTHSDGGISALFEGEMLQTLAVSTVIAAMGIFIGYCLYSRRPIGKADEPDVLEILRPDLFRLCREKFYVDAFYEATIIRFNAAWARFCDSLDYWLWNGLVVAASSLVVGIAWVDRVFDEFVINLGFDQGCKGIAKGGKWFSGRHCGHLQVYLRVIGAALVVLVVLLIWGRHPS